MQGRKRGRDFPANTPGLILGRDTAAPSREPVGFTARPPKRKPGKRAKLLTYAGDGHALTIAPSGTGKTAGPVICNALKHEGQLIVMDVKGEVFQATARRRREMGQAVHVLDLRDGHLADSLNPLDLAMLTGSDPAAIARSVATNMVARTGQERDSFWVDWAESLLTAAICWLLADCEPDVRNLGCLFDLLTASDMDYTIACHLDNKVIRHRAAVAGFSAFLSLPERETRPSVLGSALMPMRLFDSDLARHLTDRTSIDLAALIAGEPMTIYIIVPPARIAAYRPILRMWLSGLMLALAQRETLPEHRTLLMCDEIAQLGRLEILLTASTLMRGYGMQLWTFWQNIGQLAAIYEQAARTIVDNAGVVQLFGARNRRTAEEFAALVGDVDADAIMAMKADEQLLLIEGGQPRYARRVRYFEDTHFAGLYDSPGLRPRTAAERELQR